ncbi:MAG: SDR family oxidoreductase [Lewinellaceae bacterium]|nr:SDR family oxidoreductase [Lewinellaceae bacterium]
MNPRIALVTGANRGIGVETCRQLLAAGYRVILTSRDKQKGTDAARRLDGTGAGVAFHPLDVSQPASIETLQQFVEQEYGRLDVLVNNAAIHYDTWQEVTAPDFAVVQEAITTNLLGPWRLCAAFLPLMRRNRWGRIVNVSSGSGALHSMGSETPAYGITKAALNALTIKLARATARDGILANAVCPGWVRTDMGGPAAPRSVEQGAASVLWAVQLPDDGPTGGFFRNGKRLEW